MITAIALLNTDRNTINETSQALVEMDGVSEVYSVAGQWDLVVIIRVQKNDQVAELVTDRLLKIPGIIKSTTLIAFRAYSKYDLEHMFSVGLERN